MVQTCSTNGEYSTYACKSFFNNQFSVVFSLCSPIKSMQSHTRILNISARNKQSLLRTPSWMAIRAWMPASLEYVGKCRRKYVWRHWLNVNLLGVVICTSYELILLELSTCRLITMALVGRLVTATVTGVENEYSHQPWTHRSTDLLFSQNFTSAYFRPCSDPKSSGGQT